MSKTLKVSLFCLITLFFAACEKPDPNPELKDATYLQYNDDSKSTEAEVKAAEADVATALADLKAVAPQTGQNRFAEKRLWDAQNKLSHAKQMSQLAAARVKVRLAEVREKYLTSYYNKTSLQETTKDALLQQRALASTDRNWSVEKRRSALGLKTKIGKAGSDAPAAPPKAEGGGH